MLRLQQDPQPPERLLPGRQPARSGCRARSRLRFDTAAAPMIVVMDRDEAAGHVVPEYGSDQRTEHPRHRFLWAASPSACQCGPSRRRPRVDRHRGRDHCQQLVVERLARPEARTAVSTVRREALRRLRTRSDRPNGSMRPSCGRYGLGGGSGSPTPRARALPTRRNGRNPKNVLGNRCLRLRCGEADHVRGVAGRVNLAGGVERISGCPPVALGFR